MPAAASPSSRASWVSALGVLAATANLSGRASAQTATWACSGGR
jgi:hypothetical protein